MELDRIEKLLEKYFEAKTTASEEAVLRTYFSQDNIAGHLKQYAPMFRYFAEAQQEELTEKIRLRPKSRTSLKPWFAWVSVAAMVLVLVGVYFNFDSPATNETLENQYTQAEIAAAQEALSLLSVNFSKGAEQMAYLGEFERKTNRFLHNDDEVRQVQ